MSAGRFFEARCGERVRARAGGGVGRERERREGEGEGENCIYRECVPSLGRRGRGWPGAAWARCGDRVGGGSIDDC